MNNNNKQINSENQENEIEMIFPVLKDIEIKNPVWLSVSEAAKFGGVNQKTIRRGIQGKYLKYKIVKERYLLDMLSVIHYLHSNTKLLNKFRDFGAGQYIKDLYK